ncbi:agarase [Saccharobesus litoralis]|uniref:Agarase n=1 Tax=Saccharobesus litoralis TaxID=2172099 RepID=A0A2S0VNM6_9ALTE|nr:agarase [Saccharobesus litoralis]AWB65680.1 agarase [Saccharobesus litoralis]
MTTNTISKIALISAACAMTIACSGDKAESAKTAEQPTPQQESAKQESSTPKTLVQLYDFESGEIPATIQLGNATAELVTGQGVTQGKQALRVKFNSAKNKYASISFTPKQPWDWSQYESFSIALDIANQGEVSTNFKFMVADVSGSNYTRATSVPVGESKTYYSKMHGHDLGSPDSKLGDQVELNLSSGLRSNPATWQSDDVQFTWMWGNKNLNTKGIKKFSINLEQVLRDKEITIDNIRLIANPKMNPDFLANIVDKFGQSSKQEFEEKVHSEAELLATRDKELARLNNGEKLDGRSKYSGWKDGPKLKGTGYFRTEKVGEKWALVDPEGYLFFTSGIANVRMSNTTTVTGYDFAKDAIAQRSADNVTPEDSEGLNPPPASAYPTRHVVSETRKNMFEWLPDYDHPLASSYGYRREVHSGPVKHGEVFSFYMANLERKYGETTPYSYIEDWGKVTVDRMLSWGFTSFGNWIDPILYDNNRFPYFANGWIIGDFKQVSSGNDFWGGLPDVFDPKFAERADVTLKVVADEVKGSPWCVGVFVDNEKSWGRPGSPKSELGIVVHTLKRDGADTPTKNMFTEQMQAKYGTIAKLNQAWQLSLGSWDEFQKGGFNTDPSNKARIADYEHLLYLYAKEYFRIVDGALAKYLPNHMYMGVRFASWGMPKPVVKAASEYVDVLSMNVYKEGLKPQTTKFLEELDMPTVIGEFHIGTTSSGFFHPGLIAAADQKDRARMYKEYMHSVIDNNYAVGAHWFQYIDSPITGRAYDGENYNIGFVSVTDTPYNAMVDAAREMHGNLYQRRFGDLDKDKLAKQ